MEEGLQKLFLKHFLHLVGMCVRSDHFRPKWPKIGSFWPKFDGSGAFMPLTRKKWSKSRVRGLKAPDPSNFGQNGPNGPFLAHFRQKFDGLGACGPRSVKLDQFYGSRVCGPRSVKFLTKLGQNAPILGRVNQNLGTFPPNAQKSVKRHFLGHLVGMFSSFCHFRPKCPKIGSFSPKAKNGQKGLFGKNFAVLNGEFCLGV